MSLTDKLLELDEKITDVAQACANKAYKSLGLGKYDLVRAAQGSADIAWVGYGVYMGLAGVVEESILRCATGAVLIFSGISHFQNHRKNLYECHPK